MPTFLYPETCTCPPHARYSCGHCWHDQCLDCGFCTAGGCVCRCEYGLGFQPGRVPACGPEFWLGAHHPRWLATTGVPLMVSRRSLAGRRTLPRAAAQWVLDSGGFTELSLNGGWTIPAYQYAREVRSFRDQIGNLVWAAPQDWMCEDHILARTGLTVAEHQARTVGNYLDLKSIDDTLDIIPVVQGQTIADYERCLALYDQAGVNLSAQPLVGVGSICRRQSTAEASEILGTLAEAGLRLHGFGLKLDGLRTSADHLASADSLAWSFDARRSAPLPGHDHKSCANCVHWAMRWRQRVLDVLHGPRQMTFSLKEAA
ncbi:deazapurine DNA modification protein DpdA family protein [Streptomyces pseudogriseolus]|uniref:deazapurine DNA modification protein DpdA family protein n=1 Tax=Streptomyces pseudogriseolus TaxID=36817 RepID=UPI003FA2CB1D